MKRYGRVALVLLVLTFIAIQFVPVTRENRLGAGDPDAPREVMYVIRRACYDCHSTESRWPIWAYMAPMSWLVVKDVTKARAKLNFSDWAAYDSLRQMGLAYQSVRSPPRTGCHSGTT